jgi:hypothetical protein
LVINELGLILFDEPNDQWTDQSKTQQMGEQRHIAIVRCGIDLQRSVYGLQFFLRRFFESVFRHGKSPSKSFNRNPTRSAARRG